MRMALWGAALALAGILGGCTSAHVVESWKDPETASITLGKTIVICPSTNPGIRQPAENHLAAKIPGAIASYTVLSGTALDSRENAHAELKARGYDSAVLVRVLNVNRRVTEMTDAMASGAVDQPALWSSPAYFGPAASAGVAQEGYDVRLELALYRVSDGKLLWRAKTDSENPRNMSKLISAAADEAAADLRRQGLLH